MTVRRYVRGVDGRVSVAENEHRELTDGETLLWLDVRADPSATSVATLLESFAFDALALDDAANEPDLPKLDDFGDHILVVLHGLVDDLGNVEDLGDPELLTVEIDCFLTADTLVTIRKAASPAIDAFGRQIRRRPALASGGPGEVLGRLADVVCRRYLAAIDDLDDRVDELTDMALAADARFLEQLTETRGYVAALRHVLRPQREMIDQLRRTTSSILADGARRRFSDVHDLADRTVRELETARTGLTDALGAYQGAEARRATEVTKVLTVYAAVVLPLSLVAGIFGMNFDNIPGSESATGFWIVLAGMSLLALGSLTVFARAGWITPRRRHRSSEARARLVAPPAELASSLFQQAGETLRPRRSRDNRRS